MPRRGRRTGLPRRRREKAAKKAGLKLEDVLKKARERLYPWCRVCPECDGVACAGEVPGFGGIGSGASFKNNYQSLAAVHLNMRTFHANKKPDTAFTIFGEKLEIPILAAATGGTTYNMSGKIGEEEYIDAILGGCIAGGSLGLVADGIGDPVSVYERRLKILRSYNGKGSSMSFAIPGVKVVALNGALPVKEKVQSGEYPLKRPLVLVTADTPKGPVKDFLDFLMSEKGQAIVAKKFVPAK